jgi:hypothetical protein
MPLRHLIRSAALIALAATSATAAAPIDPASDLDCAIIFNFYHRVAEARNAPADELELTSVMNAWFSDEWERKHPKEDEQQRQHFNEVATALGEDPNGYREMIRTCSHRALADPAFEPYWILHRDPKSATR